MKIFSSVPVSLGAAVLMLASAPASAQEMTNLQVLSSDMSRGR